MAMGMKELLIGQDTIDTSALWEKLYTFTAMSGRRGAVICAMGATDIQPRRSFDAHARREPFHAFGERGGRRVQHGGHDFSEYSGANGGAD